MPNPPDAPAGTRPRRPLAYLALGVALAGALAAVLFAGVGTGGPSNRDGETPTQQEFTGPNREPGVNAATGLLLTLTVFPRDSQRIAPDLALRDQHGRPVSLRQYRGRAVTPPANDDECTDLCTLLANDIVAANRDLGAAARRVTWLSVNANPFHPSVGAVRRWTDQHGLSGQANWVFATGSPATLRSTWHRYGFSVLLNRKTRTVVHSTDLIFIAPDGREMAAADFGVASADTALFAHGVAQVADDLLPAADRGPVAGPSTQLPTVSSATIGSSLPGFSLADLGHPGRVSAASLRGHWTVVNFWSSTCPACKADLGAIEAASRAERKVRFLGVDVADRATAGEAVARRAGLTYPVVSDPAGTFSGAEQLTGLPSTLIVDPEGHVQVRHPGTVTTEQLDYLLETLVPTGGG